MTKDSVEISVILATYNRAVGLTKALQSFSRLAIPADLAWELIVVDNNSKDNTRTVVEEFAKAATFSVRYVFEARQGRSNALNFGIAHAQGEIIAITDDDVILGPEWLVNVKRAFDEFDCAAVAGRVLPLWSEPKPDWLEMEEQQAIVNFDLGNEWKQIDRPPLGANSAFRKVIFSKYGGFRVDLGVTGGDQKRGLTCDDTEFGIRLVKGGEKIIYAPTAVIYHPVEPHRPTKSYFLKWYFNDGRSGIRTFGWPSNAVCYFGIPRWLYKQLAVSFISWMFSFTSKRRFHHKVRTYKGVGRIIEARRLARSTCYRQEGTLSDPSAG